MSYPSQPVYVNAPPNQQPVTIVVRNETTKQERRKWIDTMENGLCTACCKCKWCCLSLFCHPCLNGCNGSEADYCPCLISCLCFPLICGCQRNAIQKHVQVIPSGACVGCCVHLFCSCCATAQEARALHQFKKAGKPGLGAPQMR